MAFSDSYTTLLASVKDWINKNNMDAVAPDMIELAQIEIERLVRIRANEKQFDTDPTIDGTGNTVTIPDDYLELKELDNQTVDAPPINRISTQEGRGLGPFTVGASPSVFWEKLDKWYFWPVADEHTLTIIYYFKPTRISASQASNELFLVIPEIYLWAALAQAEAWAKLPPAERQFEQKWTKAVKAMMDQKYRREYSGTTLRTSSPWI